MTLREKALQHLDERLETYEFQFKNASAATKQLDIQPRLDELGYVLALLHEVEDYQKIKAALSAKLGEDPEK